MCLAKQPVTSLLSFRRKESHRVDDGSFDGLYGLSKYPATNRLQKSVCVSFLSLLSCFVTRPAGLSFADVLCLVRLSYLCPSILPSLVFLSYSVPHSVLFSSLPLSFGLTVEGLCRLRAFRLTWIKYNPDLPANLQHNHTLFCGYVFVWGRLRALAATDTLFVLLYTVSNPFIPPTLNWTCWNYW